MKATNEPAICCTGMLHQVRLLSTFPWHLAIIMLRHLLHSFLASQASACNHGRTLYQTALEAGNGDISILRQSSDEIPVDDRGGMHDCNVKELRPAVLCTCKQVYVEASLLLLYEDNRFCIG